MQDMILDVLTLLGRGLWHSLRGFYKWVYYDEPSEGVDSSAGTDAAAHHTQPLTRLAVQKMQGRQSSRSSSRIKRSDSSLRWLMLTNLQYNLVVASIHVVVMCLELLSLSYYRALNITYFFIASYIIWIFRLASKYIFVALINVCFQSETSSLAFEKTTSLGRKSKQKASTVITENYSMFQLLIIYNMWLSAVSPFLSWAGWPGTVIAVLMCAPHWALYSFDYCWYYMGVSFSTRLRNVENNWPYFVGFGLPMALLDVCTHTVYRSLVPIFVLPFFIISAMVASGENSEIKPTDPFLGPSVKFFYIPMWISDAIHIGIPRLPAKFASLWIMLNWYRSLTWSWPWRMLGVTTAAGQHPAPRSPSPAISTGSSRPSTSAQRDVSHSSASRRSETPDLRHRRRLAAANAQREQRHRPLHPDRPPKAADASASPAMVNMAELGSEGVRPAVPSSVRVESWLRQHPQNPPSSPSAPRSPYGAGPSSASPGAHNESWFNMTPSYRREYRPHHAEDVL